MKLTATELTWGGPNEDWWWVHWWNPLPAASRYVGYVQDWYDGPISSFGWWFGNVSWRLPWTSHRGGMEEVKTTFTSREMAVISLRRDGEQRVMGVSYYNVYVDTRTGQHVMRYGRSTRNSAEWERQAIRDGWWCEERLRPAYLLRVTRRSSTPASREPAP